MDKRKKDQTQTISAHHGPFPNRLPPPPRSHFHEGPMALHLLPSAVASAHRQAVRADCPRAPTRNSGHARPRPAPLHSPAPETAISSPSSLPHSVPHFLSPLSEADVDAGGGRPGGARTGLSTGAIRRGSGAVADGPVAQTWTVTICSEIENTPKIEFIFNHVLS